MNIIELAKQADPGFEFRSSGALADCLVGFDAIERFAALVRAAALEEAARKRTKPPRKLPKRGEGALLDEQQYCYGLGYREGAASVRAAIRQLKETK